MSLGAIFPKGMQEESVRRQLKPGTVVKLKVVMDDGQRQEKRFVVVDVEGDTATLVINSRIGPFIGARQNLLKCQVKIEAAAHPFMDHDSHIDCSRARNYPTFEVVEQLVEKPAWILGAIDTGTRDEIIAAIKASDMISPLDAARMCASLSS